MADTGRFRDGKDELRRSSGEDRTGEADIWESPKGLWPPPPEQGVTDRGGVVGTNEWMDRSRTIGLAVVPVVAAKAFVHLARKV